MDNDQRITTLNNNVQSLLKTSEKLKENNKQLQVKLQAERVLSQQLLAKVSELEQQLAVVTLGKTTLEISGSTRNAKARINTMIKNIDKAIAILNK